KRDAWVSILIAGGIEVALTLFATTLVSPYPKQTLIEFSQTILGKLLGKLLLIPYFFGCYMIIWISVREFVEFI
ncbi:GerAB/ArcD/ProY family transporter, partial [Bacillus paranthracis]|uniref:GerAB/ArcD/ProY family transporter n=1 Tax=Bacillus paranthracis TaxID=2026186 RepID=UPI00283D37D5